MAIWQVVVQNSAKEVYTLRVESKVEDGESGAMERAARNSYSTPVSAAIETPEMLKAYSAELENWPVTSTHPAFRY